MSTLPQDYFEFKTVWESVPVGERSVNVLIEHLRLIEMRLPVKTTGSSVALTVKTDMKENVKKIVSNVIVLDISPKVTVRNAGQSQQSVVGESFFCYHAKDNRNTSRMWLADSGASQRMTRNKEYLSNFVTFPKTMNVKVGNSEYLPIAEEM
ncbi:hypothetical protein T09_7227 [Trichinella sp. T9]|nr:hypothetical protein T09_7227 [Trichinella sp. T9]